MPMVVVVGRGSSSAARLARHPPLARVLHHNTQAPHPLSPLALLESMKRKSRLLGGGGSGSGSSSSGSASSGGGGSSSHPLLKAAAKADKKGLKSALKSLATNPTAVIDEQGRTALHVAAAAGSEKVRLRATLMSVARAHTHDHA